MDSNLFLGEVAEPAPQEFKGEARLGMPQVKQDTIPLIECGGNTPGISQTKGHNSNKSAQTPYKFKII